MSMLLHNQTQVRRARQRFRRIATYVVVAGLAVLAFLMWQSHAVRELYVSLARLADDIASQF